MKYQFPKQSYLYSLWTISENTAPFKWENILFLAKFNFFLALTMLPAAAAKSLQSCPTLWDPMDCSLPDSPVPGILQARTLEWVAISFSNAWKWKVKVKSLSPVRLLATPWTAANQAPPSLGFSGQQYWSGVSLPSPLTMLLLYNFLEMVTEKTNTVSLPLFF